MTKIWNEFWFRPATHVALVATRILLAAQALWIIVSRPELPQIVAWPDPFWAGVPSALMARYGVTRSFALENALYGLLVGALLASLFGIGRRWSCLVAGVLLYHFAPFEEILTGNPLTMFRGLTHSTLGLLIIGFAPWRRRGVWSEQHRWPVAAVQFLMAMTYFGAAMSKLHDAGPAWASGDNVRAIAMSFQTWGVRAPYAQSLIDSPVACQAIAVITLALELLFPLVLVSRTAARILVPLVFVGHVGIVLTLGIVFLSTPLLLVFIDWDSVAERLGAGAAREPVPS